MVQRNVQISLDVITYFITSGAHSARTICCNFKLVGKSGHSERSEESALRNRSIEARKSRFLVALLLRMTEQDCQKPLPALLLAMHARERAPVLAPGLMPII